MRSPRPALLGAAFVTLTLAGLLISSGADAATTDPTTGAGPAASTSTTSTGQGSTGVYALPQSISATTTVGYSSDVLATHLYNNGSVDISVTAFITGTSKDWSIVHDLCSGVVVAPNSACEVDVQFSPTVVGQVNSTLLFDATSPNGGGWQVYLFGQGSSPAAATVSPTSVNFGSVPLYSKSAPSTVTLTNTGPIAITTSVTIQAAGPYQGAFPVTADGCTGVALQPGQQCSVSVGFYPQAPQSYSATLVFSDSADATKWVATLTGTGQGASAVAGPSLDFGSVVAGTVSSPQTMTLQNTGSSSFTVNSASFSSDTSTSIWRMASDGCSGVVLDPGSSCPVSVAFAPKSGGRSTATVRFLNTIGQVWTASAIGTGVVPTVAASPTAVNFGAQRAYRQTQARFVTLTNTSTVPVTLTGADLQGSTFAIVSDNCPIGGSLPAGANCQIGLTFTPNALDRFSGTLHVTGDYLQPLDIPLSGWGVPHADLELRGTGSVMIGNGQRVTLAVSAAGKQANYPVLVNNLDSAAHAFTFHLDSSRTPSIAEVWTAGTVTPAALPRNASGDFVTPVVAAGKTLQLSLRVTPQNDWDEVSAVRLTLATDKGLPIQRIDTETNIAPSTTGHDAYDLFAEEGNQGFIGGGHPGQTVTAPALAVNGSANFTVRLRNDGSTPTRIGMRLAIADGCAGSYQIVVKEQVGLNKVDITSAVFNGTYLSPSLTAGQSHDIFVTVTQKNALCNHLTLAATSFGGGADHETSYLLANLNYVPTS